MAVSISASSIGQNSATLSWNVSGITAPNYAWDVFISGSGGTVGQSGFGPYSTGSGSGSTSVTGLAAGTTYTFNIDLTLQNGNVGGGSNSTSFTTASPPVTYTITWDLAGGAGGSGYTGSVTAGSSVPAPSSNPTRSGYNFSGWSVSFPFTPSGNATITASWTAVATYPPTWTDTALASAQTATAYSDGVSATNMNYSGSYSVSAGSLPAGLSLNTASGAVTGTPTAAGSFNFTITATNSYGSISQAFSGFTVSVAPTGNMNVYNGTSWVSAPVYVWSGSAWVLAPVYVYNGSSWVMAI